MTRYGYHNKILRIELSMENKTEERIDDSILKKNERDLDGIRAE